MVHIQLRRCCTLRQRLAATIIILLLYIPSKAF